MTWGSFGKVHLITLALAVAINIIIYFILRRKTRSIQILSLFTLSLFGAGYVVYGLISSGADIFKNLPLSFWAMSTLILPFAVLTRGKRICNLLLIWSASSIIALVFNTAMADTKVFSVEFIAYFIMHVLSAGIPILLFELKLVHRYTKIAKSIILLTIFVFTVVHILNLVINSMNGWAVSDGVNYMSTLAPTSEILNFFYAIIPSPYWYMILALPLLFGYIVYWYLPEILDARRRRKPLREKLKDIDEYYEEYEEEYIDEIIDEKYDW